MGQRTVYAEVPPGLEYELTTIGTDVLPIIKQLQAWGRWQQQNKQEKSEN